MPIKFIADHYKAIASDRRADVYRMLHIAFDYGYLFDAGEIELAWETNHKGVWAPLPEKNAEVWWKLQPFLEAAIAEGSKPKQVINPYADKEPES